MNTGKYQIPFEQYDAIDAESIGSLRELARSPKHYRYARDHHQTDSDALRVGRAAHTAVYEPDNFLRSYVMWSGSVRRGKAWEAFSAAHPDRTIVTAKQYDLAMTIRDAVHADGRAMHYLSQRGERNTTLVWDDIETSIRCKARLDFICEEAVVDLVTSSDAMPNRFGRAAVRFGYHAKAAFYADGWFEETLNRKPVVLIVVEKRPPHDVVVYRLPSAAMYAGASTYRALLNTLAECRKKNEWPGIAARGELDLELPEWAHPPTHAAAS